MFHKTFHFPWSFQRSGSTPRNITDVLKKHFRWWHEGKDMHKLQKIIPCLLANTGSWQIIKYLNLKAQIIASDYVYNDTFMSWKQVLREGLEKAVLKNWIELWIRVYINTQTNITRIILIGRSVYFHFSRGSFKSKWLCENGCNFQKALDPWLYTKTRQLSNFQPIQFNRNWSWSSCYITFYSFLTVAVQYGGCMLYFNLDNCPCTHENQTCLKWQ